MCFGKDTELTGLGYYPTPTPLHLLTYCNSGRMEREGQDKERERECVTVRGDIDRRKMRPQLVQFLSCPAGVTPGSASECSY